MILGENVFNKDLFEVSNENLFYGTDLRCMSSNWACDDDAWIFFSWGHWAFPLAAGNWVAGESCSDDIEDKSDGDYQSLPWSSTTSLGA